MTPGPVRIDHVAHPSFDTLATHRFWTKVMGCALVHAQSGTSEQWNARYLLTAYGLGAAGTIDFFEIDGVTRPPDDGLPKDVRHVAFAMGTREEVDEWEARLAEAGVEFWTEMHADGDPHVYVTDPNGLVVEISAAGDQLAGTKPKKGVREVMDAWLSREKL